MNNTMYQAMLWLVAGALLVLLVARRRKRKSM